MNKKLYLLCFLFLFVCLYILKIHYIIPIVISFVSVLVFNKNNYNLKNTFVLFISLGMEVYIAREIIPLLSFSRLFQCLFTSFIITFYNVCFTKVDNIYKLKELIIKMCIIINNLWNTFIDFKYVKKVFLFLPHNIIVFFVFLLSVCSIVNFYVKVSKNYYFVYSQPNVDGHIGEITKKTDIDMSFIKYKGDFSRICFNFGTFARENDSKLRFVIEDSSGKIINKVFNTKNMVDGDLKCFNNSKHISASELKKMNAYFKPVSRVRKDNTVTVFKDKKTGNVALSLVKNQHKNVKLVIYIGTVFSIFVFLLINYLINTKKISHKYFLLLCLLYIIPLTLIIPPFGVPDETYHFYRSYNYSEFDPSEGIYKGLTNPFIKVPGNIDCLLYGHVRMGSKVANLDDIAKCMKEYKNTEKFVDGRYGSILGFVPQTIGIKLADTFTNSPIIIFYFGRLFNLFISFLMIYYAIKVTPKFKSLFLGVTTMMMFIQQMASYSYDSILNSSCVLFIAYLLKLIYSNDKITFKNMFIPIITFLIILNVKIVYFPLIVLLFFIPKEKFKRNKLLYVIGTIGISFLLWKVIDYVVNIGYFPGYGEDEKDVMAQVRYLINNPFDIFKIAYNTFIKHGWFYLTSLAGYFRWFEFKVSDFYIYVYLLFFGYICLSDKNDMSQKKKKLLLISVLIIIIMIFGALYVTWSGYKYPVVEGVQGRYFLPLIIPLVVSLMPNKEIIKKDDKIIYSFINILLLQYFLTVLVWWY